MAPASGAYWSLWMIRYIFVWTARINNFVIWFIERIPTQQALLLNSAICMVKYANPCYITISSLDVAQYTYTKGL